MKKTKSSKKIVLKITMSMTEVSSGHVSPPPLESCSSRDSFVSFWDELNAIVSPTLSSIKQEGGSENEVKAADEETSEEEWEDVGEGDDGGGVEGREGNA